MHTPTHLSFLFPLHVCRVNGLIQKSEVLAHLTLTLSMLGPSDTECTLTLINVAIGKSWASWSNTRPEWLLLVTYWKVVLLDRAVVYFGKRILNSLGSTLVAFGINKEGKTNIHIFGYLWLSKEAFTVTFCRRAGNFKTKRQSNIIVMSSMGPAEEDPSHTTSPWFSQAPQQETIAHGGSAVCSFLYLGWSESVPQNAEGSPLTSDVGNSCQLIVKEALCSLSLRLLI